MKHLLIIRLSAMGDVAMLVPVVHSLATQYPELDITVLTRNAFVPFFKWMPENVRLKGIKMDDYKGVRGLQKLYVELKSMGFDGVADMHDVLRTKFLRLRFHWAGVKTAFVNKGRDEKKRLIGKGTVHAPLKRTIERYAEVLAEIGLSVEVSYDGSLVTKEAAYTNPTKITVPIFKSQGEKWVGVAPFAAHEGKIYPLGKMHEVVKTLAEEGHHVFLFGAGPKEAEVLGRWESDRIISVCGKMGGLHNEMVLMSQLDVMLAMDSANMHIASIMGTPVVSVWGATHPKAGFTPWNYLEENIIQMESLQCRPCSVYGNKPCHLKDLRCMNLIRPERIVEKIHHVIGFSSN